MVATPPKRIKSRRRTKPPTDGHWTFLTNHATVLLYIAGHPDDTMRSIASTLGLTERTTAAAIADLRDSGHIAVRRRGRHNHYTVNGKLPLRREAHAQVHVQDLIGALATLMNGRGSGPRRPKRASRRSSPA